MVRELRVGEEVIVFGGYDMDPMWLTGDASNHGFSGVVVAFIPGQNQSAAAVVRFHRTVSTARGDGDYAVLEFGHQGATWSDPTPRIHVELCDFEPAHRRWNERRQGVWVESHASWRRAGDTNT